MSLLLKSPLSGGNGRIPPAPARASKTPITSVSVSFYSFKTAYKIVFTRDKPDQVFFGRCYREPTRASLKRLEKALNRAKWTHRIQLDKINLYAIYFRGVSS